jgi:hypothetical protein
MLKAYVYRRPKSEWEPAKKFKLPHFKKELELLFPDESEWECPLCDKMIPYNEVHIGNCPFLTLENLF